MKVSRAAAVDAQKREEASRFVTPTAACPNAVRASFHRVFTSKLAHGVANKIKRDAKRERHRARLASFGAQARRTSPASSLAAPVPCSPTAWRAQVLVNVMRLLARCADERSGADVAPGRLLRALRNLQLGCSNGRRAFVYGRLHLRRLWHEELPRRACRAGQQHSDGLTSAYNAHLCWLVRVCRVFVMFRRPSGRVSERSCAIGA